MLVRGLLTRRAVALLRPKVWARAMSGLPAYEVGAALSRGKSGAGFWGEG
jgi:hypothetical protein